MTIIHRKYARPSHYAWWRRSHPNEQFLDQKRTHSIFHPLTMLHYIAMMMISAKYQWMHQQLCPLQLLYENSCTAVVNFWKLVMVELADSEVDV
jgi:hypothetical protein